MLNTERKSKTNHNKTASSVTLRTFAACLGGFSILCYLSLFHMYYFTLSDNTLRFRRY